MKAFEFLAGRFDWFSNFFKVAPRADYHSDKEWDINWFSVIVVLGVVVLVISLFTRTSAKSNTPETHGAERNKSDSVTTQKENAEKLAKWQAERRAK